MYERCGINNKVTIIASITHAGSVHFDQHRHHENDLKLQQRASKKTSVLAVKRQSNIISNF